MSQSECFVLPEIRVWAQQQWGPTDLGDARRTQRAVAVGAALAAATEKGLPEQMGSWAATKAAYRLLDEPAVTHEALCQPHWAATRAAAAAQPGVVLFVQDDMMADLSSHRAFTGAGPIGDGRGRGFYTHNCLALEAQSGAVLGLAHQAVWARQAGAAGPARTARLAADRSGGVGRGPGGHRPGASRGHLGQRGRPQLRRLWPLGAGARLGLALPDPGLPGPGAGGGGRLLEHARGLEAQAERTVTLREGNRRVQRVLKVAWAPVTIQATAHRAPAGAERPAPIQAWVIRAWAEGVEWVLLSTLAIESQAEAFERLDWYGQRWTIEDYHKGLKTGCRLEQRQVRTAGRFTALLGFLSVVAVRLLQGRDQARRAPEAPVAEPALTQRVLAGALGVALSSVATNRGFWRGVARLGGFLARKSDGEPGWQTLWRGWDKLQTMLAGIELAQKAAAKCG
jgi:uncharacterized membrane protein YgdD (TMEM256/DUF423 family)